MNISLDMVICQCLCDVNSRLLPKTVRRMLGVEAGTAQMFAYSSLMLVQRNGFFDDCCFFFFVVLFLCSVTRMFFSNSFFKVLKHKHYIDL